LWYNDTDSIPMQVFCICFPFALRCPPMIIEIKIANYRSINAEQTLSFVAENAKRHPDNLISCKGYKLLKATALFGANASGKSNFVRAIQVMRDFVRDSATRMNEGDPITTVEPYRLDPAMRDGPSRFEITFVTDGIVYVYGFEANRSRVQSEWLTAERETTGAKVCDFQRTFNATLGTDSWEFAGFKKSDARQIMTRTLQNMLALSVGAQQNVDVIRPAYRYIRNNIRTFDMSSEADLLVALTARLCETEEHTRQAVIALLSDADTGMEDFRIETKTKGNLPDVEPGMPDEVSDFLLAIRRFAAVSPTPSIVSMRRDSEGRMVEFDFEADDSQGTQRFIGIAGQFLDALKTGAFIVLDELSASMHPLLTRRLLELFQSAGANTTGAQLLFTTHDSSLLDQDLFRRDQIWLAEKCDGASTFFSLADIQPPVRNTESFLRNYLIGRYGGTPHLGRAFDDLAAGGVRA